MSEINWRHVGRAARRVVGGVVGGVVGFFGGGGVGVVPGVAAGWAGGGAIGDAAMPDIAKREVKKTYESFNPMNAYNANANNSQSKQIGYWKEPNQTFNGVMQGADAGVQLASTITSAAGVGKNWGKGINKGIGDIDLGVDIPKSESDFFKNAGIGVSETNKPIFDNEYMSNIGKFIKQSSPNQFKGLQVKVDALNAFPKDYMFKY